MNLWVWAAADTSTMVILIPALMVSLVLAIGSAVLLWKCLITTNGDHAIVRSGQGGLQVEFDRAICIPKLHTYVKIPLSIRTLSYQRGADWPLLFRCGANVELTADLLVRVNKESGDVAMAVSTLGAARLKDAEKLHKHFESIFNDSLDALAGQTSFTDFKTEKDLFRESLLKHLGTSLSGMVIEDICLHHFRET